MNLASMLSGSWKSDLRKIAQQSYDTGRAREARTDVKNKRLAELPALVASGKTCPELAARFKRSIRTIRDDIIILAEQGKIDAATAERVVATASGYHKSEKPHTTSVALRKRILAALRVKPMGYVEAAAMFGKARTCILGHMSAMEGAGVIERLPGSYPVKFKPADLAASLRR